MAMLTQCLMPSVFPRFFTALHGCSFKTRSTRQNHPKAKRNQPSLTAAAEQWVSEQSSFICGTSNTPFSPGSLPCSGNEKVGSWCHWQTPHQNAGLNWEGAEEEEGLARSEFSHVYITARDISQSLAKLPRFPGSRVAECWKEAQAFTFSSSFLPPAPLLWGLSQSSTPFASW